MGGFVDLFNVVQSPSPSEVKARVINHYVVILQGGLNVKSNVTDSLQVS